MDGHASIAQAADAVRNAESFMIPPFAPAGGVPVASAILQKDMKDVYPESAKADVASSEFCKNQSHPEERPQGACRRMMAEQIQAG
ncbi:MAG: hypothetical protein AB7K35_12500 [Pseudorhodoplanes sp.]